MSTPSRFESWKRKQDRFLATEKDAVMLIHPYTVPGLATVSPVNTAGKDMHGLTSAHYCTDLVAYILVFLRATVVSA